MKRISTILLIFTGILILNSCDSSNAPTNTKHKITFTLTAIPSEGGTVSPANAEYEADTSLTISATPWRGWAFVRWEGDYHGTSSTDTITVSSDTHIIAKFKKKKEAVHSKNIPILAWYGIPAEHTTRYRYQEMAQAGITASYNFYLSADQVENALKFANKAGGKLLVLLPKSKTQEFVAKFKDHPALAGYLLRDEPSAEEFKELGQRVKSIQSMDGQHFSYINLMPNYANVKLYGTKNYREYVHQFIDEVPVRSLSFDFYPILGNTIQESTIHKGWYKNLELFLNITRNTEKYFWGFVSTAPFYTDFVSHPIPTLATLRLQAYSNLAYGAQGLVYHTYWTRKSAMNVPWKYHDGPISKSGTRTQTYYRVKKLSKEIQNLSSVFLGAEVKSVYHTGDVIPSGTKRLTSTSLPGPIQELNTHGSAAIVSILKKEGYSFLVVVNRSFKRNMKLTIKYDPTVMKILKNGSAAPVNDNIETMQVSPGNIAIYRWDDK